MKKLLFLLCLVISLNINSKTPVPTCEVFPDKSVIINSKTEFQRHKFISIGADASEMRQNFDDARLDSFLNVYQINAGAAPNMVTAQANWTNNIVEDKNRKGYADLEKIKSGNNPNDSGMNPFKEVWGNRQDLAIHENKNSYSPIEWMPLYSKDGGKLYLPENTKASGEIIANILKYAYTDFKRPYYYEPINEPNYKFNEDSRFINLHIDAKAAVKKLGLDVKIGGPCSPVSYYYQNKYQKTSSFFNFIKNTNCDLDFYSFHSYDYISWDSENKKIKGNITSGLPLQGVLDACASYCRNKYGYGRFHYLTTENGGYFLQDSDKEACESYLANKYFPESPTNQLDSFKYKMKMRTIDNFIMVNSVIANTMTYINNSNIVIKTVPFILLQTSGWCIDHYAALFVKENFDIKAEKVYESRLIDFYKFFKNVQGRHIHSFCANTDIQNLGFVDKNKIILVFHNLSNTEETTSINIKDLSNTPESVKFRSLGRYEDSRLPYFKEETKNSLPSSITLKPQESLVMFINYKDNIPENSQLTLYDFFATEQATSFTGNKDFYLTTKVLSKIKYASLRIGINRPSGTTNEMEISINGYKLDVPTENSIDRYTSSNGFTTTKIMNVPLSYIKTSNVINIKFSDGKSGGIGAVVLRGLFDIPTPIQNTVKDSSCKIIFNNKSKTLSLNNKVCGNLKIINSLGKIISKKEIVNTNSKVCLANLINGIYIVKFDTSKPIIQKIIIK